MTCTVDNINCKYCNDIFIPRRHNMIYCSDLCCRKATNANIMKRYHEKKEKSKQKNRECEMCHKKLSRYNKEDICYACEKSEKEKNKIKLLQELGFGFIDEL